MADCLDDDVGMLLPRRVVVRQDDHPLPLQSFGVVLEPLAGVRAGAAGITCRDEPELLQIPNILLAFDDQDLIRCGDLRQPVQHPADALDVVLPRYSGAGAVHLHHAPPLPEGLGLVPDNLKEEFALRVRVVVGRDLGKLGGTANGASDDDVHIVTAFFPPAARERLLQLQDAPAAPALGMAISQTIVGINGEIGIVALMHRAGATPLGARLLQVWKARSIVTGNLGRVEVRSPHSGLPAPCSRKCRNVLRLSTCRLLTQFSMPHLSPMMITAFCARVTAV